ncbi:MAG: hypothetical protein M1819_003329 [Sarea resinae]|nr:MAG: hypothetical protein M1819_003329 [Sarea resinae]
MATAMKTSTRRLFSTSRCLQHENPLGLPRTGTPPNFPRMQRGLPKKAPIKSVRKVIAVSSAKGGVGKSTIAVNLALSFARRGLRSGVLDTDIFGPSIPTLLNLSGQEPRLSENNQLIPLSNYGIKSMSMGYLVGDSSPVVWRGLMVMKALQQLLHEVEWGGLDILVLDLPPGTGDTQLTITQQIVLDGAVIVSTPQDIALKDAVKGINMFKKVEVPPSVTHSHMPNRYPTIQILGMLQNMSHFTCPHCLHRTNIFSSPNASGLGKACAEHSVPLLGSIPLHASICEDADRGVPTVVSEPQSERARVFGDVAGRIATELGLED